MPLPPVESRSSLYWLKPELNQFFQPDFFNIVKVNKNQKIDFVKYLALLSQYAKDNRVEKVACGYSRRSRKTIENYFENYIHHIVGDIEDGTFSKFKELFPMGDWSSRMENAIGTYKQLEIDTNFPSIRNADSFMFGLVYWILLENKNIDIGRKEELKKEITDYINEMDPAHKNHPEQLQFLRRRIGISI